MVQRSGLVIGVQPEDPSPVGARAAQRCRRQLVRQDPGDAQKHVRGDHGRPAKTLPGLLTFIDVAFFCIIEKSSIRDYITLFVCSFRGCAAHGRPATTPSLCGSKTQIRYSSCSWTRACKGRNRTWTGGTCMSWAARSRASRIWSSCRCCPGGGRRKASTRMF